MSRKVVLNLDEIYREVTGGTAKLADLDRYVERAREIAGQGNTVILTGAAPVWMYLKLAHALHGKVRRLLYSSPGQGIEELEIFCHDPY